MESKEIEELSRNTRDQTLLERLEAADYDGCVMSNGEKWEHHDKKNMGKKTVWSETFREAENAMEQWSEEWPEEASSGSWDGKR